MKFIISSTALLRSLQKISGVLSSSSTLPILEDFLFELSEDKLKLSIRSSHFLLSISDETKGTYEDVVVLYLPKGSKLNICEYK